MDLQKEIEYLEGIKDKPGNIKNRKEIRELIKRIKIFIKLRPLYSDKKPWYLTRKKYELLSNNIKLKWRDQEAIEALEKAIEHIKKSDILFSREGD